jgi:hypothetical protein
MPPVHRVGVEKRVDVRPQRRVDIGPDDAAVLLDDRELEQT